MIFYMKGSWTYKDVEDFEDGKELKRFRVIKNTVRVICRSDDASGWHTHQAIEDILKEKNHANGNT